MNAKTFLMRSLFPALFLGLADDPQIGDGKTDPKLEEKDWKAEYQKLTDSSARAYQGLQRTLSTEQEKARKAEETAALLQSQLQQFQQGNETLDGTVKQLTAQYGETKTELLKTKVEKTRLELIVSEFPQLATFEAKKLIPTPSVAKEDGSVDTEALRTLFKNYSSELVALGTAAKKDFAMGGGPPSPDPFSTTPSSITMLLRAVGDAALTGNIKQYDVAYKAYQEALQQQSS